MNMNISRILIIVLAMASRCTIVKAMSTDEEVDLGFEKAQKHAREPQKDPILEEFRNMRPKPPELVDPELEELRAIRAKGRLNIASMAGKGTFVIRKPGKPDLKGGLKKRVLVDSSDIMSPAPRRYCGWSGTPFELGEKTYTWDDCDFCSGFIEDIRKHVKEVHFT